LENRTRFALEEPRVLAAIARDAKSAETPNKIGPTMSNSP